MSYSDIIKKAFSITLENPLLWIFGFFMLGGLNFNLLRLIALDYDARFLFINPKNFSFLFGHHLLAIFAIAGIIILISALVIFTSWSKIILVLGVNEIVDNKIPKCPELKKNSRKFLWQIVLLGLITAILVAIGAVVLLSPAFILTPSYPFESFLWNLGVMVFFALAFCLACVNIFTGLYVILLKVPLKKALNLCTDFFVMNWTKILGLGIILSLVYLLSFIIGRSVVYLIQLILEQILGFFRHFGILEFSGMMLVEKVFSWLLLLGIMSGMNVFFNTALILFFLELIKPIKKNEEQEIKAPVAAAGTAG